jgi:hypothetical protein
MLAVLVFNDKLTPTNMGGLVLCVIGTLGYHRIKSSNRASGGGPHDSKSEQESYVGLNHQEYDPVRQADVELECFMNIEDDEHSDSDGELSDGWDDMS